MPEPGGTDWGGDSYDGGGDDYFNDVNKAIARVDKYGDYTDNRGTAGGILGGGLGLLFGGPMMAAKGAKKGYSLGKGGTPTLAEYEAFFAAQGGGAYGGMPGGGAYGGYDGGSDAPYGFYGGGGQQRFPGQGGGSNWQFPMMGGQSSMGAQGGMPQIAPPFGGAPPMNMEALYAMYGAQPNGVMPQQPASAPPAFPMSIPGSN